METEHGRQGNGFKARLIGAALVATTAVSGCSDIGHKTPHETALTIATTTQTPLPAPDCPQWAAHPEAKTQLNDTLKQIVNTYIVAPNAVVAREAYKPGGTNQFSPGATIVVGCGNRTLASFGAGSLRYESQNLPDPDTTEYDLSSVTKSLTTAGVMLLIQDGKLHLDDKVGKFFPQYNVGLKKSDTIKMLLQHRSGLHDPLYSTVAYGNLTPAEVEQNILNYPLSPELGHKYRYSNFGMDILYWAASKAAGMPLDQYIQANILTPLGMQYTAHFNTDQDPVVKNCAWTSPDNDFAEIDLIRTCLTQDKLARYDGNIAGHAGEFSSAGSWGHLAQAFAENGVVNGAPLFTPATMNLLEMAQPGHDYSLGTITNSRYFFSKLMSRAAIGHTGHNGPEWCADPESKLYVIMMANGTYEAGAPSAKGFNTFNRIATAVAQANSTL